MTSTPDSPTPHSVYRMSRAYFARALGRLLIAGALAVVLTVLALQFLPGIFGVVGVVVSAILLVLAALAGISLMMPPALLQLDDEGFRAFKKQTAGRTKGEWSGVSSVGTQQGDRGPTLMIAHADGAHTAVPLGLLDAPTADIEAEVQRRLDAAHGYKRLG